MSTINSATAVSANVSANTKASSKESDLSNATKEKLAALGINSEGMSEAEAQMIIQQSQTEEKSNTGENKENSTESEILSDAKSLAAKVSVSVSTNDDISDVLDNISTKLESMVEDAKNNPTHLTNVTTHFLELESLDSQYNNMQNSQSNMYAALNMVSSYNKLSHGLS